jgi:hypothetical protein
VLSQIKLRFAFCLWLPIYPACERPHSTPAFRPAGTRSQIGRTGFMRSNTTAIGQREGKRVRLFTRNGYDWSHRFPLIVEAAQRNRHSSFVIDGEAVLLGVDGRSDFNGLHSRQHDEEVQFYAFDMLVSDGNGIRKLPLSMRKLAWRGSSRAEWMASSLATLNKGKSAPTCSGTPA